MHTNDSMSVLSHHSYIYNIEHPTVNNSNNATQVYGQYLIIKLSIRKQINQSLSFKRAETMKKI